MGRGDDVGHWVELIQKQEDRLRLEYSDQPLANDKRFSNFGPCREYKMTHTNPVAIRYILCFDYAQCYEIPKE